MSSIDKEWLSLIEEVQKLVLKEEAGSVLFAEEEAYHFFQQKSPKKEASARVDAPAPAPKAQHFPLPKKAPAVLQKEPVKPQSSAPKQEAVRERMSEESRPAGPPPPSFDYKMMKETVSLLKPSLKILEEIKEGSVQKKEPPPTLCLLVGSSTAEEQQMMDGIRGAIVDVLKKTARTYPVADKTGLETILSALSSPHLKLIIITEESLKAESALQGLYRPSEPGKPGYFSGIPAALIPSFRMLNESPAAKRALWNLIKATLQETSF